jgi:CspA family cold shock protein
MGRGNDYRDRRRGRGDQPGGDPWGGGDYAPPQPSFDKPRFSRPSYGGGGGGGGGATGPETGARVKWFNAEKGFGFVEFTDGSGEAFLHIRAVEAAGHTSLESGTTLVVKTGQGQRGPQVAEIISVDASTAEPEAPRRGPRPGGDRFGGDRGDRGGFGGRPGGDRGFGGGRSSGPAGPTVTGPPDTPGTVKWYDPVKGFGFIQVDGQSKDLFVHRSALERAGLSELSEGQQVRVAIGEGRKGPEVGAIELA